MPPEKFTLVLLMIVPLVWSMPNENTVLVKSLALGLFTGAALAQIRPARLIRSFRGALPAHALLGLALASAVFSPSPSFSWPVTLFAMTLWLAAAVSSLPPPGHWLFAFPAAAAIPLLMGIAQLSGLDPSPWQDLVREHFHGRACSSLGNPNFFAAFLAGSVPFLAVPALSAASSRRRLFALGPLILAGAGLAGSGSKGGMLGFVAGLAIFGAAWNKTGTAANPPRKSGMLPPVSALLLGILLGAALLPASTRGRLVMADTGDTISRLARDESVRFRLLTWEQTLRMVREAPLLGHGLGRFQVVYPRFRLPEIISMFGQHSYMTDHPENITLEIAADLGAAGLGAWIWLLVFMTRRLWRKLAKGSQPERRLAAACGGSLAGILVANSFGVDIHYGGSAVLAACLVGAALSSPIRMPAANRSRLFPVVAGFGLLISLAWVRLFASDAALARALGLSNQGKWSEALPLYREAAKFNPASVMSRYFHASALLDRGDSRDLPEARALLDRVRAESSDYVLVNYKYWLLYNRLGLKVEAGAALARQIELDPLAAEFLLERGRSSAKAGRLEEARVDFEKAVALEPDNPTGCQYLGNLLVMQGRFRQALAVYAAGLARNPQSAELHYNSAVAAFKLGDAALARKHALAALRIAPEHVQARAVLARLGK